jgi:hypothetical protein
VRGASWPSVLARADPPLHSIIIDWAFTARSGQC